MHRHTLSIANVKKSFNYIENYKKKYIYFSCMTSLYKKKMFTFFQLNLKHKDDITMIFIHDV